MYETTALISGRGKSPSGLERLVKSIDARCTVVDYREAGRDSERRWWIEAPNLGEPFDGDLRRKICTAARAKRIAGFYDDDGSGSTDDDGSGEP